MEPASGFAKGAPERFSSCSRLNGVQMLNAELELAARRADFSARRRYASEQPPQAALSESQRGFTALVTYKPLRFR